MPDVLESNSDWASKFSHGTTNAALRQSHSNDQAAYAQALQQQQQEHMDNLIATDKTAFAIHKGQQELDMQREKHQAEMAAAAQKLQSDAELHPLRIAQMQAQTDASIASEKSRVQSDLLKARTDQQKQEDTAGLAEHINQAIESGAKPGTRDFQDYVLKGITSFPNADPSMQREIIAQGKINQTPDEMISQFQALPDELKKEAKITIGSDGKTSVVAGSERSLTPNAQLSGYNQQITQARATQKQLDKQIGDLPSDSPDIDGLKTKRAALDDVIDAATASHQQVLNGSPPVTTPDNTATLPAAENQVTATPAVPDLRVLAQKALDDPSATPEHKAAAQRILGTPPTSAAPIVPVADTSVQQNQPVDNTVMFNNVAP